MGVKVEEELQRELEKEDKQSRKCKGAKKQVEGSNLDGGGRAEKQQCN